MTVHLRRRIVVALWLLSLSLATSIRCRVWASDRALWADAVEKAPLKPRVVMNDGRAHELAGDTEAAERAYRRVIGLSFDQRRSLYVRRFSQAAAEVNLAHLDMKAGRLASAMRKLDDTLADFPTFPYAHYNRGAIFWAVGACEDARTEYRLALSGDPSLPMPTDPCASSVSGS